MSGARNELPAPEHVRALLAKLHAQSTHEEDQLREPGGGYEAIRSASQRDAATGRQLVADTMRDKFIALDADKALCVYHLVRATGALNVVEAGTSFGVSTIYLATAVGQNAAAAGKQPGEARVIATEHEPAKAAIAREHWRTAGKTVEPWIELREGDAVERLADVPQIDFVLLDIWTPMVMPIMRVLEPRLRAGCVIVADNTIASAAGYADYLKHITAPGSGYASITLPFSNGLEMTTYRPQ